MIVDWLIVGAGLAGATLAECIASKFGKSVLVIDQRYHVAGNAWDEYNEHGILVHKYGPHIFHTNSKKVWEYLSRFTAWRPYVHRVLGFVDGKLVPLPFNLNSIDQLFPTFTARRISRKLLEIYGPEKIVPILNLREAKDPDIKTLSEYVYNSVFLNYTQKQWGIHPEELSPSVTARVPVLISRDDRYFRDAYQGIPLQGYGAMVHRMLSHPKIHVQLNTQWSDIKDYVSFKRMVFTGSVDEYFNYKHGELPYRSLNLKAQTHAIERYQEAAVINFPNHSEYTRITEPKWFTGQVHPCTTTITEYPLPHTKDETIPYYPIPTEANRKHYELYSTETSSLKNKVIFTGRLGDYMYYNMDQAVEKALNIFRDLGNA
jgi:UDP-galactopyranose mutase